MTTNMEITAVRVGVARSFLRLPRSPFTRQRAVRQLFQYNRRGFHPDDRDTAELIALWRANLSGSAGKLTDLLAG